MGDSEKINSSNALNKTDVKKLTDARAHIAKKNYQKSFELLRELIETNPALAEAYYLFGLCCINESKSLDAVKTLSKAIELDSTVAEYHAMLGLAYSNIGSLGLSKDSYNSALEIDESNIAALMGIAKLCSSSGNLELAKTSYEKVVKLKPTTEGAQIGLALVLSDLGEYKQALSHSEKAMRQSSNDANTMGIVGRIHLVGGNIDDAIKLFRKAIDLEPNNGVAYYDYVRNKKIKDKKDPIIKQIEKALSSGMSASNRRFMLFALGVAYNDSKEFDKAFFYFDKANLLIQTSYSKKVILKFVNDLISVFKPSLFNKYKGLGDTSRKPVFIVGMPRSGSTLIDQVLASHSNVFSVGESKAFSDILTKLIVDSKKKFPNCVKSLNGETISSLAVNYLDVIQDNSGDAERIVNKMLTEYYYLGLIAILFPNAKIIHSMRHPLDSSLSSYFTNFVSSGTEKEWDSTLENIGFTYKKHHEVMMHWKNVLPLPILDIQYEDMVDDLETNARKIIEFCDLEWEEGCLEFYKLKRSVQTASVSQVRKPIYKSSVSRWPPYAKYLGPLVEELGDIVQDDYEQLKELGCEFKVKKPSLFKRFF